MLFLFCIIFLIKYPMYTKKHHIVRKTIITCLAFAWGMTSTVLAVAVYDANVQSRANTIVDVIKSNANTLSQSDASAYYALVRMNIKTLIEILNQVDHKLVEELNTLSWIEFPKDPIAPLPENPGEPIAPLPENPKEPTSDPITKAQRDAFMEDVKKVLNSRITEDKDFVYIDGELAISKAKYNEKDFYHESYQQKNTQWQTTHYYIDKNVQSLVCPSWYEFARTREYKTQQWDYFKELDVSPLTLETLWYYVNQVANGERQLSSTVSAQQKVNLLYRGSEIVDDKYRLTSKIYDGAFRWKKPGSIDVCNQEFWHQWQISTSQAWFNATKKFTDTAPTYERIWNTTWDTLIKPNENNCYSYQVSTTDWYMWNYKSSTYKLKRSPNEWSESCTEKAYVVCEKNAFSENYSYSHLSFTWLYLLPSWSDNILQTSFFIEPREPMNKSGINNSYWSAWALQSLDIQLTKAWNGFSNPQAIYTSYAAFAWVNPKQQFSWNVVTDGSPVICQKISSTVSQSRPWKIENGTKTHFWTLKDVSSAWYSWLYFNTWDHALDTNVRRILNSDWWTNPNYKDYIYNYRYKWRMFLLHTYEAMKNWEFNMQKVFPNFDYYLPIWDNWYYFPVSEKK